MCLSIRVVAIWIAAVMMASCGGGSGGSDGAAAAGTITVGSCVVPAGASSCQATISWTSNNAMSPRVSIAANTISTAPSGNTSVSISINPSTVSLLDGTMRLDEKTLRATCAAASFWDGSTCQAFAVRTSERAPTPFVESNQAVSLEVVLYTPLGPGPFPTVMFNHGSTGNGDNPALFAVTYTNEAIARFFVERGWLVAFPQRRGRGQSGGLYDEGFEPDRSRYSCQQGPALAGVEHALQDLDVAVNYLRSRPEVDATRMLAGGISRGGILAVVHAARRPDAYRGVFNFVGGWLGEGCVDSVVVNRSTFVRGATFPIESLWMYGEDDPFYSVAHSRANFDAFTAVGGQGTFNVYRRDPGLSGHFIIDDPGLWASDLDAYLQQRL